MQPTFLGDLDLPFLHAMGTVPPDIVAAHLLHKTGWAFVHACMRGENMYAACVHSDNDSDEESDGDGDGEGDEESDD